MFCGIRETGELGKSLTMKSVVENPNITSLSTAALVISLWDSDLGFQHITVGTTYLGTLGIEESAMKGKREELRLRIVVKSMKSA